MLEAYDHRILWYRLSDNMTVDKAVDKGIEEASLEDFAIGDHLRVESIEDDRGLYAAEHVYWVGPGTEEERASAGATWDLPEVILPSEARDERPVLRRGPRSAEPKAQASVIETVEPDQPPERTPPERTAPPDTVLDRAREEAGAFVTILPSFSIGARPPAAPISLSPPVGITDCPAAESSSFPPT
jgi:hypothetical protein